MSAFATIDSPLFGKARVPMSEEEFADIAAGFGDENDPGWDVTVVKNGFTEQPTEPTLVGLVYRMPSTVDPAEAGMAAAELAMGSGLLPPGHCAQLKVSVGPLDGDDDGDDLSYEDMDDPDA